MTPPTAAPPPPDLSKRIWPDTPTAKAMLADLLKIDDYAAYPSDVRGDLREVEREARQPYVDALRELFDEVMDGWGDDYTDAMRNAASLLSETREASRP